MLDQTPTNMNGSLAPARTFAIIGGGFGTILGLIGGTAFSLSIQACSTLSHTDLAQWIGGIGAALAAFVAIGVGTFQHRQTRSLWGKSNEIKDANTRRDEIKSAHLIYSQIEIISHFIKTIIPFIENMSDRSKQADLLQGHIRRVIDNNYEIAFNIPNAIPDCNKRILIAINMLMRVDAILHSIDFYNQKNTILQLMQKSYKQLNIAQEVLKSKYIDDPVVLAGFTTFDDSATSDGTNATP